VCGPFESLDNEDPWLPYDNKTASIREKIATAFVILATSFSSISDFISARGGVALRASELCFALVQVNIGREQWKTEVAHWFTVGLARIQLFPLRVVFNSPTLNKENLVNDVGPDAITCSSVKFNSSDYMSLSTFGVLFVVFFSLFIIFFGFFDSYMRRLLHIHELSSNEDGQHELSEGLTKREADRMSGLGS
jgi:hypothetical protein